ncbi:hypothetical protein VNI00_018195 [Paramarasmius palmivorus]|uniref:Uncharacterized protein n=1 Tax=Paramarasmius palmivorus TaxID=297713 RepID=A0AAW0B049_9AGAR
MGGSFWLYAYQIDEDDEDEFDYDDDGSLPFCYSQPFSYSYRGLHWMKGEVLRGAIAYIQSLQNAKKKNIEGACQFYIDAGIKTIDINETDEEAVESATPVLASALRTANKWVRTPRSHDIISLLDNARASGLFAGVGDVGGLLSGTSGSMGPVNLDDVVDTNYHTQELAKLANCPIELDKAGLRGLYEFMQISDSYQTIYSDQAQMMAPVLDKILPFLKKDKKGEDATEMVIEFSNLLKKCIGDKRVIRG